MKEAAALLPFVPPLVVQRFLPGGEAPREPRAETIAAATLFADVSGFTALVEALREEGERGAERVQEILNRCFGPLATMISSAGGEVLRFPGDAALALFPAAEGEALAAPVLRASAAASEAVRQLDRVRTSDGRELRLRVAVGAGSVWAAAVGGVGGRWELLVRGAPVEQLEPALALALPGEVVLSAEAAGAAHGMLRGEPRGTGLRLDEAAPAPPLRAAEPLAPHVAALRSFVPRAVQARLAAGQHEFLAEFRRVSVVFLNLRGLDVTAPHALARLQHAFATVQEVTVRFGGSVNQAVEDDKGTVFVLGFGVALHAHEDDAVRATLAALELRAALAAQGLDVRIGIASDRIFTGWRGSAARAEYALIGSSVNLAARLMQRADPVECDAATRTAARRRVLFESLAPARIKGRSEAVQVYRPIAVRAADGTSALRGQAQPLIGRLPERQLLEQRLAELERSGQGGVVFVEGEPGIGKTRLIRHLLDAAQVSSIRTLVGAADAIEQKTPYLAWKSVLSALLGALGTPDASEVERRLRDLLGADAAETFPLLNPLLPVRLAETELTRAMTPQGHAEAIRAGVRRLLQAVAARQPTLLVLEDAHWMDAASWDLAELAAREVPGLLLLLSLRPMAARPPPCQRLLDDIRARVVRLDVLSPAETLALVCRRLDVDSVPEEVAAFIHERAEGHPFFVEELAFALRDQRRLEIVGGDCRLTGSLADAGAALELSQSASGVVSSRIDALTPPQQLTLKVASVLGRHFELAGLRAVHPLVQNPDELERELGAMAEVGLLRSPKGGAVSWDFRHALIRDAAYALLPYAQRCEFHGETARWLEHRFEDEIDGIHAVLAHHYECAEQLDVAIQHLAAAGDQALAHWANVEAAHFFERVLQLDDQRVGNEPRNPEHELDRATWERKLGDAQCMLGDHVHGVPTLTLALRRLGQRLPESRSAMLRVIAPGLVAAVARGPRRHSSAALDPRASRVATESARALSPLSASSYTRAKLLEGLVLLVRSRQVAEPLGPSRELSNVYSALSNLAGTVRRFTVARAYAARAVELAEQVGDLEALGMALCRGQLFEMTVANFAVMKPMERGIETLERIGSHYLWGEGSAALARLELMSGELVGSLVRQRRVAERARETGSVVHQLWALAGMAECQLRLGLLDDAIASAQEVRALMRSSGSLDRNAPFQAAGALAAAWLRRHGAPPSSDWLELGHTAMQAGAVTNFSPHVGLAGLLEARLALIQAGGPGVAAHVQALRVIARIAARATFMRPVTRPVRLWCEAERDFLRGRQRRGLRRLRAAIVSAESFRLPFEIAQLKTVLARRLERDDPERAALLAAARSTFGALGAEWELSAVQQLEA